MSMSVSLVYFIFAAARDLGSYGGCWVVLSPEKSMLEEFYIDEYEFQLYDRFH